MKNRGLIARRRFINRFFLFLSVAAAGFGSDGGVGAPACARHETRPPNVPATINNVRRLSFIDMVLSQMSPGHARK